jgi:hypothetical protein
MKYFLEKNDRIRKGFIPSNINEQSQKNKQAPPRKSIGLKMRRTL